MSCSGINDLCLPIRFRWVLMSSRLFNNFHLLSRCNRFPGGYGGPPLRYEWTSDGSPASGRGGMTFGEGRRLRAERGRGWTEIRSLVMTMRPLFGARQRRTNEGLRRPQRARRRRHEPTAGPLAPGPLRPGPLPARGRGELLSVSGRRGGLWGGGFS